MILIFWVEVPHFAVIVAEPFAFAVTFPLELTVATEVLLLVHITASPDGETSAPSAPTDTTAAQKAQRSF